MKLLLTAALTLAASAAMAGKSTTQYLFKPGANAQALELGYYMGSWKRTTESSGAETKITLSDLRIDYGYGLSDTMAVGGYTTTGSVKWDSNGSTGTASGMSDLHGYAKGHSDFIHWGADFGFSPGKKKSDNRMSGGMSLAGNVDALFSSSGWNYGGGLTYTMNMERKEEATGGDSKITGGNTMKLAAFGEYNYGQGFVGGEFAINQTGDETSTDAAGTESKTKGSSANSLQVFGTYDFNDMATGLVSYSMMMFPASTDNDLKAYTASTIIIGARFNF